MNKKSMDIFEIYPDKMNLEIHNGSFSSIDSRLFQIIMQNKDLILRNVKNKNNFWSYFSSECQYKILLEEFYHNIKWEYLSSNNSNAALELLEQNQEKINWKFLSQNSNNKALKLLIDNPEKIVWKYLSYNINPQALELLKINQDKIKWEHLSLNPDIFEINYDFLKYRLESTFKEELIATILHPSNYHRFKYYDL
jgi:hypothetical protein